MMRRIMTKNHQLEDKSRVLNSATNVHFTKAKSCAVSAMKVKLTAPGLTELQTRSCTIPSTTT